VAVDLVIFLGTMAIYYGVYLILALSLNLEYGFAGQPDFGKVFFFSIGAYASGMVVAELLSYVGSIPGDIFSPAAATLRGEYAMSNPVGMGLVFVVAIVVSMVVGGIFGYLASYPAIRLRADYLAITLLLTAVISMNFVLSTPSIAGGANGLGGIPNPFSWLGNGHLIVISYAVLVLGIGFFLFWLLERAVNSPYGRLLKSIRDDEAVAKSFGKITPRRKAQVLVIASAIAALSGALYTFFINYEYAGSFTFVWTANAWIMIVLGGVGNNRGALLGAFILAFLDSTTSLAVALVNVPSFEISYGRNLVVAVVLILMLVFRPKGIIPEKPLRIPFQED
jgi:branched-chain amino acid transport system permease protein